MSVALQEALGTLLCDCLLHLRTAWSYFVYTSFLGRKGIALDDVEHFTDRPCMCKTVSNYLEIQLLSISKIRATFYWLVTQGKAIKGK